MGDIERAIQKSDLGLTPANDGTVVRIPIPPLTEERRKDLVKHVHRQAEDHKVGIREAPLPCLIALVLTATGTLWLFFFPEPFFDLMLQALSK